MEEPPERQGDGVERDEESDDHDYEDRFAAREVQRREGVCRRGADNESEDHCDGGYHQGVDDGAGKLPVEERPEALQRPRCGNDHTRVERREVAEDVPFGPERTDDDPEQWQEEEDARESGDRQ